MRVLLVTIAAGTLIGTGPLAGAVPDPTDGACGVGRGSPITVYVSGLRDLKGQLKVELYPANERDFLRDDRELVREGKPFRRVWSRARARTATLCIAAPAPGRYALLFTHDRDGKNKFNIWSDGIGVPGAGRIGRSKPRLRQAIVEVGRGGARVTIHVQYLTGLSGFRSID